MTNKFSSYNINDSLSEKQQILEFARKRNAEHLKKLKESPEYIEKEKQKESERQKLKLAETEKFKAIMSITDEDLKENIKMANENNKKFGQCFNQYSNLSNIFDTIFESNDDR